MGSDAWACEHATKITAHLLGAGADPNLINSLGQTALHIACSKMLHDVVAVLLAGGADPCLRDYYGDSALDAAGNSQAILSLLEPYRAKIEAGEPYGDRASRLIEKLLLTGIVKREELVPCTADDIAELERLHGVTLPESYKRFLREMGRGAGQFLTMNYDHWSFDYDMVREEYGTIFYTEQNEYLHDCQKEAVKSGVLTNFFLFAARLNMVQVGFFADGSNDDPPIYYDGGDGKPVWCGASFWDFFNEQVDIHK